ncbi:hypothetical protein ACJBU6_08533 [Exserohilum turcicum]
MAEATSQPATVPTVEEPVTVNADQQTTVSVNMVEPIFDPQHAIRDPRFAPGARQAFFSTKLGTQAPRSLGPVLAPPVVRSISDPATVVQAARYWQTKYKNQCLCILPNQGWIVEDLWDIVDLHVEGRRFCEQMLKFIMRDTWYAADKFAKDWARIHPERFDFTGINIGNVYDLNDPLTAIDQIFTFGETASFPRVFLWHVAFILISNWNDFNQKNNAALEVRKTRQLSVVTEQDTNEAAESLARAPASDVKKAGKKNRKHRRRRSGYLTASIVPSASGDLARSTIAAFTPPNQTKSQPHTQHIVPRVSQQPGDQVHPRTSGIESTVGPPTASPNTRLHASNLHRGNRNLGSGSYGQTKGRVENESRMVSGSFSRQKPVPVTGMQPQYVPTHMPMGPQMAPQMMPGSAMGSYVLGPPMMPQPGYPIQSVDPVIASRAHMGYQPDATRTLQMPPPYINQPRGPHAMLMGDMTNMHFQGQMSAQVVESRAPMSRRLNYANTNQLFDPYSGTNRKFSSVQGYNDATRKGGPGGFVAPQNRGRKMSSSGGRPAYNSYNPMSSSTSHYTEFSARRRVSEDDPNITGDTVFGCGHTWIGPKNATVNELWIGDLPHDVLESELLQMFEQMVKITSVSISLRSNATKGPFHAFATFASHSDTKTALTIIHLNPRLRNGEVRPAISVPRRFYQKELPVTAFFDHSRAGQATNSHTRVVTNISFDEKKDARDFNDTKDTTGGMVLYSPQDARSGLPKKPPAQSETMRQLEAGSPEHEKSKRPQKSPAKKGKGKNKRDSPAGKEGSVSDKANADGKLTIDVFPTTSIREHQDNGAADANVDDTSSTEVQVVLATNTMLDVGHAPDDGQELDAQPGEQPTQSDDPKDKGELLIVTLPQTDHFDPEVCLEKTPSPVAQDIPSTTSATQADKEDDDNLPQLFVEDAPPLTAGEQTSDDEGKNDNSFHSAPEVQPEAIQVETEAEVRDEGVSANQESPESPVVVSIVAEELDLDTDRALYTQPEEPAPASSDAEAKPEDAKPEDNYQQDSPVASVAAHEEASSATKDAMMSAPIDMTKKGGAQHMQSLHPFATKNKAQAKKEREIKRKQQKKEEADRIAKAKADKASKVACSKKAKKDVDFQAKDEASVSPGPSSMAVDASSDQEVSMTNTEERIHEMKKSKTKPKAQPADPSTENQKKETRAEEMNRPARDTPEDVSSVTQAGDKVKAEEASGVKKNSRSPLSGPTSTVAQEVVFLKTHPDREVDNPRDDSPTTTTQKPDCFAVWVIVSAQSLPTGATPTASYPSSPQHMSKIPGQYLSRTSSVSTLAAEAPSAPTNNSSVPNDATGTADTTQGTYTGTTATNSDTAPIETPKKKKKRKNRKKKASTVEPGNSNQSEMGAKPSNIVSGGHEEDLQGGDPFGPQLSHIDTIRRAVKKDTASHLARTIARLEKEAEEREVAGI